MVGVAVWGAQPLHASMATSGQTYYRQINNSAFKSNAEHFLAPQAMPATVAVPMGERTLGAQYSAARLQTGSSAKVQSYGEYSGYSYGGGDSHAAYNSSSVSNGNVSQYSIPTIGVRSTLRGKAYASADEAYAAATGKAMMRAPSGPGGGPITGGDGENKPGLGVPVGDAPWLILVVLMIAYAGVSRLRRSCGESDRMIE